MPNKKESLRGFIKGVINVSNRFNLPKGAFIAMSNLLMNERGALQTCDGTVTTSILPSSKTDPILTLSYYVDPGFDATKNKIIGLTQKSSTLLSLYNFSTNPATLLLDNIGVDNGWVHPQLFNFAGAVVLTSGFAQVAALYTEPAGIPTLTAISATNAWIANHHYTIGDQILASNGFAFEAVTPTQDFSPLQGGVSGGSPPTWPSPSSSNPNPIVFDGTVVWRLSGEGQLAGVITPQGCAHGISHEGALWFFGTYPSENSNGADGPMSLRQSHLNSTTEWPGIYAAFIGKDDGQRATGIGSFTIAEAGIAPQGGLVLFKDYSTYNLTANFASTSFAINPVKTDMGCIAPRSVQFVPGMGLVRLTHLGVALYDGRGDQLISEEIRPYILGGFGVTGISTTNAANSRSALVANPPMYVLAIPTGSNTWCSRLLCYDLILKAWNVVDLPFQISSIQQIRIPSTTFAGTPFPPITYLGGAADGILRRWQAGDASTWDTGASVAWSLTTPEIGGEASGRLYCRRTTLRMHASTAPSVTLQPTYGSVTGPSQTKTAQQINPVSFGPNQGGNQGEQGAATYEGQNDYIDVFQQGVTAQTERLTISGSGRVTLEAIELEVQPKQSVPLGQPA